MKLVLVDWVDSDSCNSWQSLEIIKERKVCLSCQSVGWLVVDGPDSVTLVASMAFGAAGEPKSAIGEMTIPRVAVKRIKALKLETKK